MHEQTPSFTERSQALLPKVSRRTVLQAVFMGAAAASAPRWLASAAHAQAAGSINLPTGPLANIGPLEKKSVGGFTIPGIDEQVYAPAGFEVRVVARAGLDPLINEASLSGYNWHIFPDGGAVFPSESDGGWVYVSNSELPSGFGGVGALRFDAEGHLIDAYPILRGTSSNCAGGATPWGTWLSCEENGAAGQVYECDPFRTAADAVVKPALGSFNHEAAAIDPIHHVVYETEDAGDGRFYRFVTDPSDRTVLDNGVTRLAMETGQLEVMNIQGFEAGGYPEAADIRSPLPVSWSPAGDGAGTRFAGGEGLWYYEVPDYLRSVPPGGSVNTRGVMFFATKGDNRVWALDIENELVELVFDNDNMQLEVGFDDVDNVTVSPFGDVLVAEDGDAMRLVVIVPNGEAKVLMQITRGLSEITGPAFTPDGSRLYFSSQRGPTLPGLQVPGEGEGGGVTFEMTIPEAFRALPTAPPAPDPDPEPDPEPPAPDPEPAPEPNVTIEETQAGSATVGGLLGGAAAAAIRRRWLAPRTDQTDEPSGDIG